MTRRRVWLGAALATAVLVVLGVVAVVDRPTGASSAGSGPAGSGPAGVGAPAAGVIDPAGRARLALPRRIEGDPLALGRVDAPLVMVEWGDFQCPYCAIHAQRTEPELLRQYVDSGLVRLEWRDYAYLGPESVLGATAARAAGRQGRFWDMHAALFRQQGRVNSGTVTDASLVTTAGGLGLDVARFTADLADPTLRAAVEADRALAADVGVTGVPSFVLGADLLFGAQPLPTFQQAIDTTLARRR